MARTSVLRERPETRVGDSQLELAAEIAEEVSQDRPASAADDLSRAARVARATHHRTRVKPGSLLAARAATEYVYVAKDMRRIVLVSGALFGIMLVLYVLLVVARVVPLPFY